MKRILVTLTLAIVAIATFAQKWTDNPTQPAKVEEGTYAGWYNITTAEELAWVAVQTQTAAFAGNLLIANDIDLSGKQWEPIGHNATTTSGANTRYFNGSIDGQGHTISGLDIQTDADDYSAGFIGGTNNKNASIRNLNIEGTMVVNTTANGADFGSLIGFANALEIVDNCHSAVNVTCNGVAGSYLGGLVGRCKGTSFKNCSYSGTLSIPATSSVKKGWGGLIGTLNSTTSGLVGNITDCLFSGTIDSNATAKSSYGGGLIGYSNLSKGTVTLNHCGLTGTMNVDVLPTNFAHFTGTTAGTYSEVDCYKEHFMVNGEEFNTTSNPIDPIIPDDRDEAVDPKNPAETVRILAIGNSFTEDALSDYFIPICQSAGRNVIVGYPYKGGTSLEDHVNNYTTNNPIYNYKKNSTTQGSWRTTGAASRTLDQAIDDDNWDVVIMQQAHYPAGVYDTFFPYINQLKAHVAQRLKKSPYYYFFFTWADDASSSKAEFGTYYGNDQQRMYDALVDVAFRVAEEVQFHGVIPAGTTIQNCRTSYIGQNMTRDGYHMNYEYGRYVLSLTWAAAILGIDPQTVTFHPASITDSMAQLCRDAVTAAMAQPKAVTSMAEKWGVNPDVQNQPLARNISLVVNPQDEEELMGTEWNMIDATNTTSEVINLIDAAFLATPVAVTVAKPFTTNELGTLSFTGLYPGQEYTLDLIYNTSTGSALAESDKTLTKTGIISDVNGRLYVDFSTASNNGDELWGVKALVIKPALTYTDKDGNTQTIDPTEGVPTRIAPGTPWDGTTLSEPALGAGKCYVINSAAELAWVANLSNQSILENNIRLFEDIDLANHKWTPIGKAYYFNGNIYGGSHTIRGLYLNPDAADVNCGLIGQTSNTTAKIKDINLEGRFVVDKAPTGSNSDYGSFVGLANGLDYLQNCHSSVSIEINNGFGAYVGGLIGRMKATNVVNCSYSGNFTVAEGTRINSGFGGLVGTANSNSTKTGSVQDSYFLGNITYAGTTAAKYGAAIIGYPRLYKSSLTIKNCYAAGTMTITGSKPTNYGVIYGTYGTDGQGESTCTNNYNVGLTATSSAENVKPIVATVEQMNSGELAYTINTAAGKQIYGQDLSLDNGHPVAVNADNSVFKTEYIVDSEPYATIYNNATLRLPATPDKDGYNFIGWFNNAENGDQYTESTAISTDLTLYAQFSETTGLSTHYTLHSTLYTLHSTHSHNIAGQRITSTGSATSYKGIIITGGRKYLHK